MKEDKDITANSELRKRVEDALGGRRTEDDDFFSLSPEAQKKRYHELQVHRIELEIQNEEFRKTQPELEASRDRYSDLYNFAPIGYFTLDQNGVITEVNLAGADLLGAERHFLIGQRFTSYISSDFQDAFYFHQKRVLETGTGETCELTIIRADGRDFHGRLTSVADRKMRDNGDRLRTAVSDISDLKNAEECLWKANQELEAQVTERTGEILAANRELSRTIEELRKTQCNLEESEARYKALFEYNPIQTIVVDFNGKITAYNLSKKRSGERLPRLGDRMFRDYAGKYGVDVYAGMLEAIRSKNIKHFDELVYEDKLLSLTIASFPQGAIITTVDITDLKRAERRIRMLTHDLIVAQENERHVISRELHDRVAQDLSALRMTCETLFDNQPSVSPQIVQKVSLMSKRLLNTIKSVRDISYDLRPPGLKEIGLPGVISQHCQDFSESHGIESEFHCNGMDRLNLDLDTQLNLYRIIQEGLNNILKHANSSRASVTLNASFPHISLCIEDTGKGFDVKKQLAAVSHGKRMGLRSMQERVHLLEGDMEILSRAGEGTSIVIRIPIQEVKSGSTEDHSDR